MIPIQNIPQVEINIHVLEKIKRYNDYVWFISGM